MSAKPRSAPADRVTHRVVTPELVRGELASLERKYGMSSPEFLRRYLAGELDEPDMVGWEFYCDMAKELGLALD